MADNQIFPSSKDPQAPKRNPSRERQPDPASLRHDERAVARNSKDNDRKRRQSIPAFLNEDAGDVKEELATVDEVGELGLDEGRKTATKSNTGSKYYLSSSVANVIQGSEPSATASPPPQPVVDESDNGPERVEEEWPPKALADLASEPLVLRTTQSLGTVQKDTDTSSYANRKPDSPAMDSMRKRSASTPVIIDPLTSLDLGHLDQSTAVEGETSSRSMRRNSGPAKHRGSLYTESSAVESEYSNYNSTTRDIAGSSILPREVVRSMDNSDIESLNSIGGCELTFATYYNGYIEAQDVRERLEESCINLDLRSDGRLVTRSLQVPIRIRSWFRESDSQHAPCLFMIHTGLFLEHRRIASISGLFINRYGIRAYFLTAIKSQDQKMFHTLSTIFDRYGRLRQVFKDQATKKGTSVWGDELDQGHLLIIGDVHMNEKWNHKQLAIFTVVQFILWAGRAYMPAFVLIDPTFFTRTLLSPDTDQDVYRHSFIHALRTLGFRRIGFSAVLALPTNTWHPSFSLIETEDRLRDMKIIETGDEVLQIRCMSDTEAVNYVWAGEEGAPRLRKFELTHPLHWAAMTLSDETCADVYIKEWQKYSPDDPSLELLFRQRDPLGRNVLHVAALEQKVSCVAWLIKEFPDLKNQVTSLEGLTPVQGLEAKMEKFRTTQTPFTGFSAYDMSCLDLLRAVQLFSNPSEIEMARTRYGCTCGTCVGGFMSPRTNYALKYKASELHLFLDYDKDIDDYWVDHNAGLLKYVDPKVLGDLRYSQHLREGFINLFFHMAQVLESQTIPTAESIKKYVWEMMDNIPQLPAAIFLDKTTEAAIQIVFQLARDCDEWAGNGQNSWEFKTSHDQHPICRNDHDWEMVARMCGLKDLEGGEYS